MIFDEYNKLGISAPLTLNDISHLMRAGDIDRFVRHKMKDSIKEEVEIAGLKMDKTMIVNSAKLPSLNTFSIAVNELVKYIEELNQRYLTDYSKKQIIGSTSLLILDDNKVTVNQEALNLLNDKTARRIINSKSQEQTYEIAKQLAESLNELVIVSKDLAGRPLIQQEVNFSTPGFIFQYNNILEYDRHAKKFKPSVNFVMAN